MVKIENRRKNFRTIAFVSAGAAATIIIGALFMTGAVYSSPAQSQLGTTIDELPILSQDEVVKTFLIGYEMVGPTEKMNKVSIEDFPWMADMIQYGEAMVSVEEGNKFLESSAGVYDYAILMKDGSEVFYNINIYQVPMVPNTAYVKAYWLDIPSENKEFVQLDLQDNQSLLTAVTISSTWIPVENIDDAARIKQFIEGNTKYVSAPDAEGAIEYYELRYIDASQERVS